MAKTTSKDDIDAFIDSIDPSNMREGTHLREVAAARQAVADSQERLKRAVQSARAAGDSWTMIGVALRTSKQNAHRKFGSSS